MQKMKVYLWGCCCIFPDLAMLFLRYLPQAFKGGVMIVSHDQHFINKVCSELWVVGSGEVAKYPGEFDDYKNEQVAKRKAAGASL